MNDKPDEGLPKIAAATGGGYFELTSTTISRRRSGAWSTNGIISTRWVYAGRRSMADAHAECARHPPGMIVARPAESFARQNRG